MTYTNSGLFALRRVRYTTEPLTAYAINQSSSLNGVSAFSDILATEATTELIEEMVDNNAMQQRIDGMLPKVNTRKRCNLSFTSYLNGPGVTTSLGNVATATDNNKLLTAVMGGIASNSTQTILSASARNHIFVATSSYSAQAGSAIGVVDPSTGYLKTARVRYFDNATGEVYLAHELGFDLSGSTAQAQVTNFLTQDTTIPLDLNTFLPSPQTSTGSLQFYVQGAASEDNWVVMGLNGGFSLKTEIGQLPEISYKLDGGADWVTGSAEDNKFYFEEGTYSESVPPPLVNGFCWVGAYGSDPQTESPQMAYVDISSIEITPAISYAPITSEGGVNNILRVRRQRAVPVATGKFVLYYNNNNTFSALVAGTLLSLELQIGNTVGNTIMISCPRIKVTAVKNVDAGGASAQEVTFDCLEDVDAETTPAIPYVYFPSIDMARSALTIYTF